MPRAARQHLQAERPDPANASSTRAPSMPSARALSSIDAIASRTRSVVGLLTSRPRGDSRSDDRAIALQRFSSSANLLEHIAVAGRPHAATAGSPRRTDRASTAKAHRRPHARARSHRRPRRGRRTAAIRRRAASTRGSPPRGATSNPSRRARSRHRSLRGPPRRSRAGVRLPRLERTSVITKHVPGSDPRPTRPRSW